MKHLYVSTACTHDMHAQCRRTCKYCDDFCRCDCHTHQRGKARELIEQTLIELRKIDEVEPE